MPKAMPISPSVVAHTSMRQASTATGSGNPCFFCGHNTATKRSQHQLSAFPEQGLNDIYVCPNILKTDRRNKGTAVTYQLLHSDADDGADPSKVAALGGFAVCSGSPRPCARLSSGWHVT